MQIKVLVFTDHIFHKKESTLYPLLRLMAANDSCKSIDVVSKGNPANRRFFEDLSPSKLFATTVGEDFGFQTTGSQYINKVSKVLVEDYDFLLLCLPDYLNKDLAAFLQSAFPKPYILNSPIGIYETTSRAFFLELSSYFLPLEICKTPTELKTFKLKHTTLLHPLEKNSERATLKLDGNNVLDGKASVNFKVFLLDMEEIMETEIFMAMQWDENIAKGVKKIIVFSGEALGAKRALPSEIEWEVDQTLSNWEEITEEEVALIQAINPTLKAKGIYFYEVLLFRDVSNTLRLFDINTLFLESILDLIAASETKMLNQIADKMLTFALGKS